MPILGHGIVQIVPNHLHEGQPRHKKTSKKTTGGFNPPFKKAQGPMICVDLDGNGSEFHDGKI